MNRHENPYIEIGTDVYFYIPYSLEIYKGKIIGVHASQKAHKYANGPAFCWDYTISYDEGREKVVNDGYVFTNTDALKLSLSEKIDELILKCL